MFRYCSKILNFNETSTDISIFMLSLLKSRDKMAMFLIKHQFYKNEINISLKLLLLLHRRNFILIPKLCDPNEAHLNPKYKILISQTK